MVLEGDDGDASEESVSLVILNLAVGMNKHTVPLVSPAKQP